MRTETYPYSFRELFTLILRPERRFYWLMLVYALAVSALTLSVPLSVQVLISTVANAALVRQVMVLSLVLLALFTTLMALSLGLFHVLATLQLDLPGTFVQVSMVVLLAFLALLVLRYFGLRWFSYLAHLDRHRTEYPEGFLPLVTILVPAYNEGAVIQGSIRSLLPRAFR